MKDNSNDRSRLWEIVKGAADRHELDPVLVLAIIEQESAYRPDAIRAEPSYPWLWPDRENVTAPVGVSYQTEVMQQRTSWGLMQIMGAVAREFGFRERFLTSLLDPALNVEFGCRLLRRLRSRWPVQAEHISAYNAGHPTPANSGYVAAVQARMTRLELEAFAGSAGGGD